jgi:hypothetical protein
VRLRRLRRPLQQSELSEVQARATAHSISSAIPDDGRAMGWFDDPH